MPRKSITQVAADTRKRTAKWRESRAAMRMPEARSIDRAALEAMFYVGRQSGPDFMITRNGLLEISAFAVKLLTYSYNDDDTFEYDVKAVGAAVAKRLLTLKKANRIGRMLDDEKRRAQYAQLVRLSAPPLGITPDTA